MKINPPNVFVTSDAEKFIAALPFDLSEADLFEQTLVPTAVQIRFIHWRGPDGEAKYKGPHYSMSRHKYGDLLAISRGPRPAFLITRPTRVMAVLPEQKLNPRRQYVLSGNNWEIDFFEVSELL